MQSTITASAYQRQPTFAQKSKSLSSVFWGVYRAPSGVLLLCYRTAQCHVKSIQTAGDVRLRTSTQCRWHLQTKATTLFKSCE